MREVEMFLQANQVFTATASQIKPPQWEKTVPTTPVWTVRQLVNHVAQMGRALVEARSMANLSDDDILGDDPGRRYLEIATAAAQAAPAITDPSQSMMMGVQACDRIIHNWDLAGALGLDQTIDPKLAQFAYDFLLPNADQIRASGAFGPAVPVPADADIATKLLGLSGRHPSSP